MKESKEEAWGIPALCPDRLATTVPTQVYAGGTIADPTHMLFIWRSVDADQAHGGTLGFFLNEGHLERLWVRPAQHAKEFMAAGVTSLIEVGFSVVHERTLIEQVHNIHRMRIISRVWQGHNLSITPLLQWGEPRSFAFCFSGIPVNAPVVACECRTVGSEKAAHRAFLRGLREAVQQVQPRNILIYGGSENAAWLKGRLPAGPKYTLLESWSSARRRAAHASAPLAAA